MLTALGLLAVVALIAANGYFVAAEFSFVASRRRRIEDLASEGDRRATNLLEGLRRLSFMLSGAQLGITVTSLVVGFIAEGTLGAAIRPLVEAFGVPQGAARGLAFTIGLVIATAAQMVFGELAPKNLAIAKPEPVALALAGSIRLFLKLASPVITLFDSAANRLLRLLGIEPVEEIDQAVSPEELAHIIEESERQGDLSDRQAGLLARVLEFRELRAGAVMVPRTSMVAIEASASCDDLRRLAVSTGLSRFPVVAEGADDIRGVVQAKSVFRVSPEQRTTRPVTDLMTEALAVPESALLGPLLSDFRDRRTHMAIVVDEHGGTAGIVSLEDLLEELVGEIRDEHDRPEPAVMSLPDGSYRVPGSWRLDETRRDTGVALPEGDYETLSGLVMSQLGRVPERGDAVELDVARLEVERLSGHAVGVVRLRRVEPAANEDAQP
jgi:CBS domain containing-hemolysin-like protein